MKFSFLILFAALSFNPLAMAEDAIAVGGAPEEVPEDPGAQGGIGAKEKDLEFILESSGVSNKFEACKENVGADKLNDKVSSCLWNPTQAQIDLGLGLSGDEKEVVTNKVTDFGGKAEGSEDSGNLKFESIDKGFLKQVNQEPSFLALQEHMRKKLEKTIYGEEKGLTIADHTTFHKLFKSQLTKNVIQAMSSYCLDADPSNDFLIEENKTKLADQRKKNIDNLANSGVSTVAVDPSDPTKGTEQRLGSEANFNECVGALKHICYATNSGKSDYNAISKDSKTKDIYKNSKTRACNVVTYIKQLKQNIIAVNDIETKLEKIRTDAGASGNGFQGNVVENLKKTYMVDQNESLTVMSSKEFVEESGFKDAVDVENDAFKKCFEGNAVVDEQACKKYLSDKKEENEQLIAEADLRSRALEKKIDDSLAEDPEKGVRSYLLDQAFSEEEIEKLLASKKPAQLAQEIKDRYAAERKAYIDTLAEKIKGKTQDDPDLEKGDNKARLTVIQEELSSKAKRYTELIHFTNIVAGYLKVSGKDGAGQDTSGRNTTSLAIELGDSAYNPNGGSPSGTGRGTASNGDAKAHADKIEASAESVGIKPVVEEGKDSSISAKSINDILGY